MRLSYAGIAPVFPGFEQPSTRAPWPVWKGSANITKSKIKPPPAMTRKKAAEYYRELEDFEGRTRLRGRQDGAIGRNGLAVARAFLWRFLNWRTGQLDPSYAEIAKAAKISERSVARGVQALRRAGVLEWVRRCIETTDKAGRFALAQISNLYGFCAVARWIGYTSNDELRPEEPPPPDAIALGLAEPIERGTVEAGTFDTEYELMEMEALAIDGDPLSIVLARVLRRQNEEVQARSFTEMPDRRRNPTELYNNLGERLKTNQN